MTVIRRTSLDRDHPFSFACRCCGQCCRTKKIQVNPYETARLARNLGISTTKFIARYTLENGSCVRFDDNNTCPFLGTEGCTVHAERPLVCRLYPLGRHVNEVGDEWFSELEPEAECRGAVGTGSAVADYLEDQSAADYMRAADSYLAILWQMMNALDNRAPDDGSDESPESDNQDTEAFFASGAWLDMDKAVEMYCRQREVPIPDQVDEKMRIHQQALHLWINGQL
ncbi:MAG: YkgJ family cysteine cluster protein [Chlorobiaceae bacterium]|nr:YkgJ family cysteine cluster protein [Chlorobiaceae bacterium]